MADIVDRLQSPEVFINIGGMYSPVAHLAAAEITHLRARVAELEGALDFYACVDHYQTHNAVAPNVVQFDRGAKARAALAGGKDA